MRSGGALTDSSSHGCARSTTAATDNTSATATPVAKALQRKPCDFHAEAARARVLSRPRACSGDDLVLAHGRVRTNQALSVKTEGQLRPRRDRPRSPVPSAAR